MRGLCRIFRATLTCISCVLLVCTLALWVRGYFRSDYILIDDEDSVLAIYNRPGGLSIWCQYLPVNEPNIAFGSGTADSVDEYRVLSLSFCGFAYEPPPRSIPRCGAILGGLRIPYYAIASLTLVLPLPAAIRALRSPARKQLGRCRNCGYDLRATPTRCPECGQKNPQQPLQNSL